jgi:hypothetical protein
LAPLRFNPTDGDCPRNKNVNSNKFGVPTWK